MTNIEFQWKNFPTCIISAVAQASLPGLIYQFLPASREKILDPDSHNVFQLPFPQSILSTALTKGAFVLTCEFCKYIQTPHEEAEFTTQLAHGDKKLQKHIAITMSFTLQL